MLRATPPVIRSWIAGLPSGLRATALFAVGIVWSRGVGLLMVPVLTAYLPPAAFGRLELLTSAAEIGGLMVGAGLVETLFRFAGPNHPSERRAAGDVMGLTLALAAICLVCILLLGPKLAAAMPLPTPPVEIALLGVLIVADAIIGVPLGWLRITGSARRHAVASGLRASLQAGLVALLLVAGFGVAGVLAGGAIAASLAACWLVRSQAKATGIGCDPRAWPPLLAYGVPLIGTGVASFVLGSADRWLLAGHVPTASLGHYALATRFAMIVAMLMQPFDMWWYARRIALLEQSDGLVRTATAIRIGVAGIASAAAATAAAGPFLIHLLAPATYAPAMPMVPFLVLSLSLQMLSSLVNVGCYIGRTTTLPLVVNVAAAAVALGLYLLLIPEHGVFGAIEATLAAQSVRLVAFTVLAQRRIRIALPYGTTAVLALLAAASGTIPQLLGTAPLGLACAVAAALGTALAAAASLRAPCSAPGAAGRARSG